jgi:hypothetical protein
MRLPGMAEIKRLIEAGCYRKGEVCCGRRRREGAGRGWFHSHSLELLIGVLPGSHVIIIGCEQDLWRHFKNKGGSRFSPALLL